MVLLKALFATLQAVSAAEGVAILISPCLYAGPDDKQRRYVTRNARCIVGGSRPRNQHYIECSHSEPLLNTANVLPVAPNTSTHALPTPLSLIWHAACSRPHHWHGRDGTSIHCNKHLTHQIQTLRARPTWTAENAKLPTSRNWCSSCTHTHTKRQNSKPWTQASRDGYPTASD